MLSTGLDKFSKIKVNAQRSKVKSVNKPDIGYLGITMNRADVELLDYGKNLHYNEAVYINLIRSS